MCIELGLEFRLWASSLGHVVILVRSARASDSGDSSGLSNGDPLFYPEDSNAVLPLRFHKLRQGVRINGIQP